MSEGSKVETYVEKPGTIQAIKWDGTIEGASEILAVTPGAKVVHDHFHGTRIELSNNSYGRSGWYFVRPSNGGRHFAVAMTPDEFAAAYAPISN